MKNTFLAKTYTITMTVPRAIALGIGSLVLISWFFFLGLIVGRGYEPEKIIPQVAQIMPQPGEAVPSLPVEDSPSGDSTAPAPAYQQQAENNGRSIIAEADQAYRASIKQNAANARQNTAPSLAPPPATQQAGQQSAQQGAQTTPQTSQQADDVTKYAFTYQLASFKEEKAAQALQNKLKAAGFKPRINTSKSAKSTWYRVLIDFTGTTGQAEATKTRLKKDFKLGDPLKLSQKKSG